MDNEEYSPILKELDNTIKRVKNDLNYLKSVYEKHYLEDNALTVEVVCDLWHIHSLDIELKTLESFRRKFPPRNIKPNYNNT